MVRSKEEREEARLKREGMRASIDYTSANTDRIYHELYGEKGGAIPDGLIDYAASREGTGGSGGTGGSAIPAPNYTGSDSAGGAQAYKTDDPVASDLAPHQKAFLNAVSGGESSGRYNVRYDGSATGAIFDKFDQHPAIFVDGPHGKSSAAGRYMFTKTTWDRMGGGDFAPENQDTRAWQLAVQDYKANTGRDLDTDLQETGLTPEIMGALKGTWAAFGNNQARHQATYNDSLSRYSGGNNDAPQQALDVSPQVTNSRGATPAQRDTDRNNGNGFMQTAFKAIADAGNTVLANLGISGEDSAVETWDQRAAQRARLMGHGAAKPSMMQQVFKAIDPKGEMPEAERTMKGFAYVHDFFMKQGEPEKAQQAAASMYQYYRQASNRFLAAAQGAIEKGDVDEAAEQVMRAHANIPDGNDLKITRTDDGNFQYEVVDVESGEVLEGSIMTPEQAGAAIMGMNPGDFDRFIMQAAGMKVPSEGFVNTMSRTDEDGRPIVTAADVAGMDEDEQKTVKNALDWTDDQAKHNRPGDYTPQQREESIGNVETYIPEVIEDPENTPPEFIAGLTQIANDIVTTEGSGLDARSATYAAADLLEVDPQNPDARNFEIRELQNGGREIFFPQTGATVRMPEETFNRAVILRGEQIRAAKEELRMQRETEAREQKRALQLEEDNARIEEERAARRPAVKQRLRAIEERDRQRGQGAWN